MGYGTGHGAAGEICVIGQRFGPLTERPHPASYHSTPKPRCCNFGCQTVQICVASHNNYTCPQKNSQNFLYRVSFREHYI